MNTQKHSSFRPKWKHILTAALLTTVLAACGSNTPPTGNDDGDPGATAPEGIITGTITTSAGAAADNMQLSISNVTTPVAADSLEALNVTSTNADGLFAFDVTNAGTYGVTGIQGNEGVYFRVPVTRNADGNLTSEPVALSTAPLGAVTGALSEERDGIMVSLLGTSFLALTDSAGAFSITGVPAGSYSIAASVSGTTGASHNITVKAGETTNVVDALTFGPIITGVTPEGIHGAETRAWVGVDYPVFEITGSGFGPNLGVSRLFYAGKDITNFVTEWTDTSINIDPNIYWYDYGMDFTSVNVLRFTIATLSGETHSPIAASIWTGLFTSDYEAYGVDSELMNGFYLEGITFDLATNHGALHAGALNGPITTSYTTGLNAYFYPVPSVAASTPMITTISFDGTPLSSHVTGNHGYLDILSGQRNTPGQTSEAQLQLTSDNGTYTDDGNYTHTISNPYGNANCPALHPETTPFRFNSNGEATITIPALPRVTGDNHCSILIEVQYDGTPLASADISLTNDYEVTGIDIMGNTPAFADKTLTLNSGEYYYPQVHVHHFNAETTEYNADMAYWAVEDPSVATYAYTNQGRIQAQYNYGTEPISTSATADFDGHEDTITIIVLPYEID